MLHSMQLPMELTRCLEYMDVYIVVRILQTLYNVWATSTLLSARHWMNFSKCASQTCCFWNSSKRKETLSKYQTERNKINDTDMNFSDALCKYISDKAKRWALSYDSIISLCSPANTLSFMEWIGCWAFYQLKCV